MREMNATISIVAILYELPTDWIRYNHATIQMALVEAKTAVRALAETPFQRDWVEKLQEVQLKLEVAGTSRIEGADFTEGELDAAMKSGSRPENLLTRSQKQAFAAAETYRWISSVPLDRPVDESLITEIHRRIVTSCDDDHCPPGQLRRDDQNVTFGNPRHRGCGGGDECQKAFGEFLRAAQGPYRAHDPLIQALALHYHLAAMHPFLDGNGRTARALEALVLRRAGLRTSSFIAMSNYYYDEKLTYLATLSEVRAASHDLTAFLLFALKGISIQCERLLSEIRKNVAKALYRNMMFDLFNRLRTRRARVIKDRQIELLKVLLDSDALDWQTFVAKVLSSYKGLKNPGKALTRDVQNLLNLGAVRIEKVADQKWNISVRLSWPSEITESEFFRKIKEFPKGKTFKFLS